MLQSHCVTYTVKTATFASADALCIGHSRLIFVHIRFFRIWRRVFGFNDREDREYSDNEITGLQNFICNSLLDF
jgi:Holliday junction resolvasome RuvABC DNA-binding subunit